STCPQTITVHDTISPVVTGPANLSVQCDADIPAPNLASVSAADNCDPAPVLAFVSDVPAGACPKVITRTYKATDACGNVGNYTQTITVHDTTAPVITSPANLT